MHRSGLLVTGWLISSLLYALAPEYEPAFIKASLAYQSGDFDSAEKLLRDLETKIPNEVSVLELKALCLKSKGEFQRAAPVYRKLYEKVPAGSEAKRLAYAFELGSLAVETGLGPDAEKYLSESIRGRFNVSASRFLLGKYYFNQQNWERARKLFSSVTEGEDRSLKATAHLYLAQAHLKENHLADTLSHYVEAREQATDLGEETDLDLARRVFTTADNELRAYARSTWITDVGVSTGYDSNVLSVPNSGDSAGASRPGSAKESLNWRIGYISSPVNPWQYIGSYQGSVNWNLNTDTKAGQFFSHDVSSFLTRGSLKTTQYGFKVGGVGTLQYQTDAFRPYSLMGNFGPYYKTRVFNGNAWLGGEAFFSPTKNYIDPTLSESLRRSGWETSAKVYLASAETQRYFNPAAYLTGTFLKPNGSEFQGTRWALDLANSMYLNDDWFVAETLGFGAASYSHRPTSPRTDQSFSAGVSAGYRVSAGFTLLASVSHLRNLSSEASYRYNRWSTSLGTTYRF